MQVHTIKGAVRPDGTVDLARLEEGASLLPQVRRPSFLVSSRVSHLSCHCFQTCDTFMRTLEAVAKHADAGFVYTSSSARVGDPAAELAMMGHHTNGTARKVRLLAPQHPVTTLLFKLDFYHVIITDEQRKHQQ